MTELELTKLLLNATSIAKQAEEVMKEFKEQGLNVIKPGWVEVSKDVFMDLLHYYKCITEAVYHQNIGYSAWYNGTMIVCPMDRDPIFEEEYITNKKGNK